LASITTFFPPAIRTADPGSTHDFNAGPGFVAGVQQVGLSLFLWGAVAIGSERMSTPARCCAPRTSSSTRLSRAPPPERRWQ
jgi:hypothetical protein